MLSSHGGDGGSSPPESTHSHILACVCGRPARHAIATRNNPVRLRADALNRYADPVLLAGHAPLVRERRGFDSLGRLHARAPARPIISRPGPAPQPWARRAPARPRPRAWTRPWSPKPGEVVRFHPVAPLELRPRRPLALAHVVQRSGRRLFTPARRVRLPSWVPAPSSRTPANPRRDGFDSRRFHDIKQLFRILPWLCYGLRPRTRRHASNLPSVGSVLAACCLERRSPSSPWSVSAAGSSSRTTSTRTLLLMDASRYPATVDLRMNRFAMAAASAVVMDTDSIRSSGS